MYNLTSNFNYYFKEASSAVEPYISHEFLSKAKNITKTVMSSQTFASFAFSLGMAGNFYGVPGYSLFALSCFLRDYKKEDIMENFLDTAVAAVVPAIVAPAWNLGLVSPMGMMTSSVAVTLTVELSDKFFDTNIIPIVKSSTVQGCTKLSAVAENLYPAKKLYEDVSKLTDEPMVTVKSFDEYFATTIFSNAQFYVFKKLRDFLSISDSRADTFIAPKMNSNPEEINSDSISQSSDLVVDLTGESDTNSVIN